MKKVLGITAGAIIGVIVLLIVIGVAIGAGKTAGTPVAGHTTSAQPAAQTTTAAPTPTEVAPNPSGTYRGSCDYTLPDNFPGKYHLVGEVDLHNDGNIGTTDHVVISWPQEGAQPVTASKNVRSDAGARSVVRFRMTVSQSVIDSLQSWQTRHGFKDGCTYKVAMTGTFGTAS
jgi:hypothetical protein